MKRALFVLLLAAVSVMALRSVYVIDETEMALVTRFGRYRSTVTEPGLQLKIPFAETVHRMDSRVLSSDPSPTQYLTRDKKRLKVDPVLHWRIEDPFMFYKSVRDRTTAQQHVNDVAQGELRRAIARVTFGEIIGNPRSSVTESVRSRVQERTEDFGIGMLDIQIKRADLPAEVRQSVIDRMRAERERVAKRYRAEGVEEAAKMVADADKERTLIAARAYEKARRIEGQGDAEGLRLLGEAHQRNPDAYVFLESLRVYEKGLSKATSVVLSSRTELFQYLDSASRQP